MKINLNKQFVNLEGKSFEGDTSHMGKTLANNLVLSSKGQSIKLYDWAVKLFNKQTIDVDQTDFDVLKALIETSDSLNNLCKAQILKTIGDFKNEK